LSPRSLIVQKMMAIRYHHCERVATLPCRYLYTWIFRAGPRL